MINGDDLFNSFAKISYVNSPLGVWIFSKVYFYVFIALFIYVVLSLFIGIIGDTYERLKVCGIYNVFICHPVLLLAASGLFLESSVNFSGPQSHFRLSVSRNRNVYTPENYCIKGTSGQVYVSNKKSSACYHKV